SPAAARHGGNPPLVPGRARTYRGASTRGRGQEMAGTFVYWMNVSLDLRIEHASGEAGGGEWLRIDEALHREFNARAREWEAMVQGRVVYDIMESFWPSAAEDADAPDYLREYGHIWTSAPKVLLSRTRTEAGHNTRIFGSDAIERLADLRDASSGRIG